MKKFILIFVLAFYLFSTYSQTLPFSRSIDWTNVGVMGGIPCPSNIYDVTQLSIVADRVLPGNSATVNSTNLNKIINDGVNYPSPAIFYFPAGTYNFNAEIAINTSGRIIRGASASTTIFLSSSTEDCFNIIPDNYATSAANDDPNGGNPLSTAVNVTGGYNKGSTVITVADASSFVPGLFFEIYQADNSTQITDPQDWARNAIGMLAQIVSVNTMTNEITIDRPLRLDFNNSGGYIRARCIQLIQNVGFENFFIKRTSSYDNTSDPNNTIFFRNAANCWVCGIESDSTMYHHVRTETCTNITIRNSYFHHAYGYTADHGYGARCGYHTGSCLIENNVFFTLRHAMLVEQGASGNVYLYNYTNNIDDAVSNRYTVPGGLDQADISIHGLYCNMNLFEGNIVEKIECSDAFGAAGPGNTFLRNRISIQGFGVEYGSNNENIIGNEFTNPSPDNIYYIETNTGTLIQGNNLDGVTQYESIYGDTVAKTFYYTSEPTYFSAGDTWPSIGPEFILGSGTIPAQNRYDAKNFVVACNCSPVGIENIKTDPEIEVYPNPFIDHFIVKGVKQGKIIITDLPGHILYNNVINGQSIIYPEVHALGMYILKIYPDEKSSINYQLIKQD